MVYKKKRYYSKTKKVSSKKLATKKYVKSVVSKNEESKHYFYNAIDQPVDAGPGYITDLTDISQGVTAYTRIGNKITPQKLKLKMSMILGDPTFNRIRVLLIQWKTNDNVDLPQIGEIFNMGTGIPYTLASFNDQLRSQFTVLKDFHLTTDSTSRLVTNYSCTVYPKGRVEYVSSTNKGRRHIYMIMISDSAVAPYPKVEVTTDLVFKDA